MKSRPLLGLLLAASIAQATCRVAMATPPPANVDAARLFKADVEPGEWMSTGRTYDEQHFSPLEQINVNTVGLLSLAGYYDIPTKYGQEATPLVVDGVMYLSTDWSIVKALDATTGRLIWSYDPRVVKAFQKNCCAAVNRGVALWKGKVFVGALDGRLIALDASTGEVVWQTVTVDQARNYTITGAPRVIKGKVLIGNGGAEFGVRGYVTAYDADTGKEVWRFYTVPGRPGVADGAASDDVLETKAAATWSGDWWKSGGGGTVWDSMAYDPQLDLVYIGVGNGGPWNQGLRSAGQGDNLFISSIVALRADTGKYVWHYQTTPGEAWDFTATQNMILADLILKNQPRQVLMQAPKNGFLYVIDRRTGELLSATAIVPMTWANGVNLSTGRPNENPDSRYYRTGNPFLMAPSGIGAHNWQPMSFSPITGLLYIPVQQFPAAYLPNTADRNTPMKMYIGVGYTIVPQKDSPPVGGWLAAWDPIAGKEVWRVAHPMPWNGGVLSTKGGLVFQGDSEGRFSAYAAADGRRLWSFSAQAGIVAAPMTYRVRGEQYVAVMAGWGGTFALIGGGAAGKIGPNRLLIFKLGGRAALPTAPEVAAAALGPPADSASAATVAKGEALYFDYCSRCHGVGAMSGGVLPDLRYSGYLAGEGFSSVLLDGALAMRGMGSFASALNKEQVEALRAYVVRQANLAGHAPAQTAVPH